MLTQEQINQLKPGDQLQIVDLPKPDYNNIYRVHDYKFMDKIVTFNRKLCDNPLLKDSELLVVEEDLDGTSFIRPQYLKLINTVEEKLCICDKYQVLYRGCICGGK